MFLLHVSQTSMHAYIDLEPRTNLALHISVDLPGLCAFSVLSKLWPSRDRVADGTRGVPHMSQPIRQNPTGLCGGVLFIFMPLQHSLMGPQSGISHSSAEGDLQTILSHLSPYFPFTINGPSTMKRDIKAEQAFQDLNLIFCELSSSIVLASQRTGSPTSSGKGKRSRTGRSNGPVGTNASGPTIQTRQIERVSAYIVQLLQGQVSSFGNQSSLPRPVTTQAYVALLPTIWCLFNSEGDAPISMLAVVVEHAIKTSSTSAVKRHTIDFIGRLLLVSDITLTCLFMCLNDC